MGDNDNNNNYRIERRRVVAKATRRLKIFVLVESAHEKGSKEKKREGFLPSHPFFEIVWKVVKKVNIHSVRVNR